jgi:hypothetical protein
VPSRMPAMSSASPDVAAPTPDPPALRDAARRNTRLRFEQWANNPSCEANTFSAVHNVRMDKVAAREGHPTTFGQSPFAIARGRTFEAALLRNGAERLLEALIEEGVLPAGATGLEDLRLKMNGGPRLRSLDEAIAATTDLLTRAAAARTPAERRALPAVIAGATVRIPRGVMLPEAVLILDALALRSDGERPELIVGEVKTYPDRGGHTDAAELAAARAQAGVYLHALQLTVAALDLGGALDVALHGFLVLTRPGSSRPSVRAGEQLRYQAERARRGFDRLEQAALALPAVAAGTGEPASVEEELLQAVMAASTSYSEACLSFCDRAAGCHAAALAAGDPIVLGEDVRRFLGAVSLPRALELLDGAVPANPSEEDLVRRIADADPGAGR